MKIPTNLKHSPVICTDHYDQVDGRYAHNTDTQGLSLGLAQWDRRGKELSAKVWRYTGDKWSRQSEELPLHRVLDLAIMIAKTKIYFQDAYKMEKLYDDKDPSVAVLPMQGEALRFGVCTDNENIDEDIQLFRDALQQDDEILSQRLHELKAVLNELI